MTNTTELNIEGILVEATVLARAHGMLEAGGSYTMTVEDTTITYRVLDRGTAYLQVEADFEDNHLSFSRRSTTQLMLTSKEGLWNGPDVFSASEAAMLDWLDESISECKRAARDWADGRPYGG